jgi:hypothetical protein
MLAGKAIYYLLSNNAGLSALVGTRVFPEIAEQNTALPYVVYTIRSNEPSDTQRGPSELDTASIEVNCFADTYQTAIAISVAVRAAIDRAKGTYSGVNVQSIQYLSEVMGFDEMRRVYFVTADYQARIQRDASNLPQVLIDAGVYNLDDLSDVNAPNPTDGQALVYDSATDTWGPGDVSATLADLTDVLLDEPLDREALVYDEVTTSWINGGTAKVDFPCYNADAGLTIAIGTVVAYTGVVHGDRMGIAPFSASSANDPRVVAGIATEAIGPRQAGHVRSYGNVYGMNTNAYTVGTILYASTTAGQLTSTAPTAPNHRIAIAVVTKQNASSGRVFCRTYTPAYRLADLSNVASTTPNPGQGLVWNGSTWAPGAVGYVPGSPPPGGFLGNVFYQDNAGNLTFEDAFRYTASTNTLAVENITGTTVTGTGVVKGSNTFGQRYATQAATNRALADTASITVERYFTVTAEGNGESFNIQSDTPSAGNKIVRKIWYKDEAFEATDVDTWTLLHTFADDTAYASTATKWQEYLDGQTYGKPPFTLALSWEDVPAVTGIIDGYTADLQVAFAPALLDINYTGDCIRVRRASDNTEQDIGFDNNGELDTTALTTFCTGTDCFIKTWYDQSGNGNDGTQSTTASQPKIYDSSTGVLLDNAVTALTFDGTDDHLTFPLTHANNTFYTVFMVRKSSDGTAVSLSSATSATLWADISETSNSNVISNNFATDGAAFGIFYKNGVQAFSSSTTRTQYKAAMYDGNQILLTILGNGTQTSTTSTSMFLGRYQASGYSYAGTVQCLLVYQSATANKSTDRAAIESALNDYFNVY